MMKTIIIIFAFILSFFLISPSLAQPAPVIQNIVVFGDSLSDNGNYFRDSGGKLPPPPYAQRASDGRVWAEYLARFLNVNLDDQAYLGAATKGNNPLYPAAISLKDQVDKYLKSHDQLDGKNTVYVLWAGANNIFAYNPNDPFDEQQLAFMYYAYQDLSNAISALKAKGARLFLVPGLPDFANIPLTNEVPSYQPLKLFLGMLSLSFNYSVEAMIDTLNKDHSDNFHIVWSDINNDLTQIIKNASFYGFQNTSNSCYMALPNQPNPEGPCNTPSTHFFWDLVHPTTKGHCFLAYFINQDLAKQGWVSPPSQDTFNYCYNLN